MFKVRAGLHLLAYIFESGIFKDSFGIVNISGPPKTQEWDNNHGAGFLELSISFMVRIFLTFDAYSAGAMRNFYCALFTTLFGALVHGLCRCAARVRIKPPGHGVAVGSYCSAIVVEPDDGLAILGILRTVLQGGFLGRCLVAKVMRVTICPAAAAIGNSAIFTGRGGWARARGVRVLNAVTLLIPAANGPTWLSPCRCGCTQHQPNHHASTCCNVLNRFVSH